MPYIGRGIETLSDRVVLDSLTASATASYTLQLNSVNFVPSSASSLTVSLNGVIQKPDSSYTVSGSTLTFSSALTSSDSIDFIIAERDITLQTPSAGSVNTDQLAASAVTAAKINDGEITNAKINSSAAIATTKLGSGAVLQVVQGIASSETNTTSASFTDTGLSASITPTSTSSKILVTVSQALDISDNTDAVYGGIRLLRGTTSIFEPGARNSSGTFLVGSGTLRSLFVVVPLVYLDSPSTTSATTYKTQGAIYNGEDQITFQKSGSDNQAKSTITLVEIAG